MTTLVKAERYLPGGSGALSYTYSYTLATAAGNNRVLVFATSITPGATAPTTATFNGVNVPIFQTEFIDGGRAAEVSLFVMLEADLPAAGTYDIVASWSTSNSQYGAIQVLEFSGVVDQVTPVKNYTTLVEANVPNAATRSVTLSGAAGDLGYLLVCETSGTNVLSTSSETSGNCVQLFANATGRANHFICEDATVATASVQYDYLNGYDGVGANSLVLMAFSLDAAVSGGVTADGDITLPSLVFTGSATDTTSQTTISGAITLPSLVVAGSATDTTPQITIAGDITLPSLVFTGSATDTTPEITITGAITLPSLVFAGSATDTTSQTTITGDITLPSLIFAGSATDTSSGVEITGNITLPSLIFAGSATDTTPAITVAGAITLPSLVFDGSATVTLPDVVPPVITLLGSTPIDHEALSAYVDAGATALDDVDGDVTGNIVTVNSVNDNVIGSYSVTYDVDDAAGNSAIQVVRTVNVVDTTAPVITMLGSTPVVVEVLTSYVDAGATALDAYDGDVTGDIVTNNQVNINVVSVYNVVYDVVDSSGNAATTVARVVQVVDTTPPIITRLGDAVVTHQAGTTYTDAGATAFDLYSGNVTSRIAVTSNVNVNVIGSYTVEYDCDDLFANDAITVTRTVNVDDTIAPVITLLGDAVLDVPFNSVYNDAGATAFDSYYGNVTGDIIVTGNVDTSTLGQYVLSYDVQDASGNIATTVQRTVDVVLDVVPPVITITGNAFVFIALGETYIDPGATAADNVDGDITGDIITTGTVDTNVLGEYFIDYDVTDSSGNTDNKQRSITVQEFTGEPMTIDNVALKAAGDNLQAAIKLSTDSRSRGAISIHSAMVSALLNQTVAKSPTAAVSRMESDLAAVKSYLAAVNAAITA